MKLTKRMKNSIIQGVVANTFFLVILLVVIGLFVYPRVIEIENNKTNLTETYTQLQEIKKKGISFGSFKSAINSSELAQDSYTLNLMKNISQEFYTENFSNTGAIEYDVFLSNLKQEIELKQSSDEYIQKDQTLSTILPIYDEKNIFSNEGLSDFYFINYIENILYSFNLSSDGEIGIGELKKVGEDTETPNEQKESDSLQEDIYSIPLFFEIVGQKTDIVDFLHYFENVGGIEIVGENLKIYEDEFITRRLEGAESELNYNIYKNQIADIEGLSIKKYPDSSSLKTQGLLDAMKGSQSREKMSLEIELSFYVSGVPGYKIEEYIQDFLLRFQKLQADISRDAQKYTSQVYKFNDGKELLAITNLQSLNSVLLALSQDIVKLRTGLVTKENIDLTYNQAVIYAQQISRIESSYQQQLQILNK